MHTQVETARQILFDRGGDYLLTVKGNQPTLQETLQDLFKPQALSPSAHSAHQGAFGVGDAPASRPELVQRRSRPSSQSQS